jgi:uncharacterized damage-inducible protein DinB
LNNDALKEENMLSQGAIIERAMKAQRKQIEMLQQQNKQLRETIERIQKIAQDDGQAKRPNPLWHNLVEAICKNALKGEL